MLQMFQYLESRGPSTYYRHNGSQGSFINHSEKDIFPHRSHFDMERDFMGKVMMKLIRIKGNQAWLQGINPSYCRQQGFPLCQEALEDFERRHDTWCLGQFFHDIVVLGSPCIRIVCCSSNNVLRVLKQCVK
jgi:hypothetical protein